MATISVILVNYQSSEHTLTALDALRRIDWPSGGVEIIVVDNASGDGSVEAISAGAPDVVVEALPDNVGFAGGCNAGVARATGRYIALLNPDAKPDKHWLTAAIDELERDPQVGAVGSKVLSWDGSTIDFVAAAMSFAGQGYKQHAGLVDHGYHDVPKDILFASGAALVMPRDLYLAVGGFDERYFMFFEDVDLGWRLWLNGYKVRYVPASLVYHRHHATMEGIGDWYEAFLLARNALFTIYKNYDDDNIRELLAPALLTTLRRGVDLTGFDQKEFDLASITSKETDPKVEVDRRLVAPVAAVDAFIEALPGLTESRRSIQAGRVRSDAEVMRTFQIPFAPDIAPKRYQDGFRNIVSSFELEAAFTERRKIVIHTADILTPTMAGPAIRVWNIAKLLSEEHEVKLVSKFPCGVSHPDFECIGDVHTDELRGLEHWADIIIFQGFLLHEEPWLVDSNKVIVVDLYDPFHLEQLEQSRFDPLRQRTEEVAQSIRVLNQQLRRGDFFMCASGKQRDLWLGQLSALQRINPLSYDGDESLKSLLSVVPFGLEETPPEQTRHGIRDVVPGIGLEDKVIIWGGGIYNWFDPLTLIRAVDKLRTRVPEVRLYFLGTKHPNPDVPAMRIAWESRRLAEDLGILDEYVFFNDGWVPYEDRQNYLLDADIGVSTHLDHVETEFSFRTRILDYFWARLPTVSTEGDTLGELIADRGLGLAVPAEDVDALEEALHRLLTDDEFAEKCRSNIDDLIATYHWRAVLEPLVQFCRSASRAPDRALHEPEGEVAIRLHTHHAAAARPTGLALQAAHVKHALQNGGVSHLMAKTAGWVRKQLRP